MGDDSQARRNEPSATNELNEPLLKPSETPGAGAAAITSALLIAQQVAGKAARDALFLSSFHSSYLPVVMGVGAVLSLFTVYWLSSAMVRRSPAFVLPILLGASAVGYTVEWVFAFDWPHLVALAVYFHTAMFGPMLLSAFWSLINERFDPHAAKRAVARIAAGGTLGGVLGGLVVWRASKHVQPATVILLLAVLNALALVGGLVTRARKDIVQPSELATPEGAPQVSPLRALLGAPFLRNLALLVALGTATSAILDYIFSFEAVAAFGKGPALLSYFSIFWLSVGVLSFVLQLALGRLALEKLGLAVSVAVMPGLIILGGAFGLAVPGLASASLLRGAEAVQRNTLFRSAYELFYTPIPEERKRATKLLIDVGFDRVGTVVGSSIALVTLFALSRTACVFLSGVVVVLALATLPVVRWLHAGYVSALQDGLRDGAAKLQAAEHEPPSRKTNAPGRETLIQRIEELQPGGLTALLDGESPEAQNGASTPAKEALNSPEALLSTVRALLSADPVQAKGALGNLGARGPEVACAILLLAHEELHAPALGALSRIAPEITGQLIDALLDLSLDFAVRRRIPRVLRKSNTQRAAEGLLLGIADPRFEVRYECGRALLALTSADSPIVISREKALEAIKREVEGGKRILDNLAAQFDDESIDDEQQSLVNGLVRDRVDRSLEHVFTILCLHLEREPLRMAFRALHHEDTRYRGTALEYLDTILPAEIRDLVWPLLGEAAPLPSARTAQQLLAEMAQTGTLPTPRDAATAK